MVGPDRCCEMNIDGITYLDINTTKMKMIIFTIADQRNFNEYKVEFLKELSKINDISFEMMRK